MPNKNHNKAPAGVPENMATRSSEFRPKTFRADDNSVEFTLSTETPAMIWDWNRYEVVKEVLVADGVILPKSGKVPLQDSHDRSSIDSNLGSVRDIEVKGGKVVGRVYFDETDGRAVKGLNKVRGGHIDSGSVGYEQVDSTWLDEGDAVEYNGRRYKGPMLLTKKWALKEFSLVAIGADPNAKARAEVAEATEETIETVINSRSADDETKENLTMEEIKKPDTVAVDAERMAKEATEKLAQAERALTNAKIMELTTKYDCKHLTEKLIADGVSIERAQEAILAEVASRQPAVVDPKIEMGDTDETKFRAAVADGMFARSFGSNAKLAPGHESFMGRSLMQIGEELLQRAGVNTRNMSRSEIAGVLLGRRLANRGAMSTDNTTASFANITENVLNKAVMKGFNAQGHCWDKVCSIGSTSDFKSSSRVGLSENADLALKKEGAEYRQSKFSDKKESGSIGTYADATTLTEEALINDDLGVLTVIPQRKGAAAMRVPETLLFAAINTPPTLNATSLAWFHANNGGTGIGNKMVQANGLDSTNLAAAIARMRSFKGFTDSTETNTDYLDIQPKTLLVHQNNYFTARILLNSAGLPETSMSEGVYNPFKDEGIAPAASSRITTATKFYLFADPNLYPTAEMLFLDGKVGPESFLDPSTNIDGLTYRIRIRCGLIVLEWRTALEFAVA